MEKVNFLSGCKKMLDPTVSPLETAPIFVFFDGHQFHLNIELHDQICKLHRIVSCYMYLRSTCMWNSIQKMVKTKKKAPVTESSMSGLADTAVTAGDFTEEVPLPLCEFRQTIRYNFGDTNCFTRIRPRAPNCVPLVNALYSAVIHSARAHTNRIPGRAKARSLTKYCTEKFSQLKRTYSRRAWN